MSEALIELSGVGFAYDAQRPIYADLDFRLDADERVCITGPNGSGKTTLLQLIVGLVHPTSGTVSVFGAAREAESDFREVRKSVGYVFQDSDSQLFCPTVYEDVAFGPLNLGLGKDEVDRRVTETLERLHFGSYRNRVTYRLSHGEKRIVALATVLAMEPRVLLLDEPTSGLDEEHEERLTGILGSLGQEMIVVSHNRPFMERIATRVAEVRERTVRTAQPHY